MSMRHAGSTGRAGRRGGQNLDLLIGSGVAVVLGIFALAAVLLLGRSNPPIPGLAAAPAPGVQSPGPVVPPPRIDGDSKLVATRSSQSLTQTDSAAASSDPVGDSAPPPGDPPQSQPAADAPIESDGDTTDVRTLMRRVRREVKKRSPETALGTARQIASLVPNSNNRSRLQGEIERLEAEHGQGQLVDFDSLIQLIEQTIEPNSWSTVGGAGTIQSFPGGVYVDTAGLLKPRTAADSEALERVRRQHRPDGDNAPPGATLRKLSLPGLERELMRQLAAGTPISDDVRYLAGLQDIRYLLVYPETRDIVLVGTADDWHTDALGRVVGRNSGRPVLQLEDLAVILRACFSDSENYGLFGCGIYPRAERLQQVQEFLARSAAAGPIDPSQRDRWLQDLRDQLGPQDIEVFGIHPASRVAHVLVEADYRMKLIGIGLEPAAVPGIPSYFDLLGQPDDARLARPIDTLRWWFTLNYDAITASDARDAFELRGGRVAVLSENELLTATGQRVHTGQSDPMNAQFARNFTEQFPALADRDVNFADLAGIFDLAVVSGLLRGFDLPNQIGWPMTTLLDPDEYIVSLRPPAKTVETVMNHRVYRQRHIMAAISGGVHVNPWKVVSADRLLDDSTGALRPVRASARSNADPSRWWWD